MDTPGYLDAIRSNGAALVDAAESAGLAAPVPPCPDWTVADLLGHVGRTHRWVAGNAVRAPIEGLEIFGDPAPLDGFRLATTF